MCSCVSADGADSPYIMFFLQNCLHSALMPYNALNISAKSSVDRGEFCLQCHLHSCLCRGRHIICASQKKMCREVEKSVALTENPLPLCRNVRVALLFMS